MPEKDTLHILKRSAIGGCHTLKELSKSYLISTPTRDANRKFSGRRRSKMAKKSFPRSGSMQFWPRKRSKKSYARIKNWPDSQKPKPLAFAGYKVGMTHVMGVDNTKDSPTEGEEIPYPVTVIECPPLRIVSVRTYTKRGASLQVSNEYFVGDHKDLDRKIDVPDNTEEDQVENIEPGQYEEITVTVHTIPSRTGIEKKTPEIFELHLGGNNSEKLEFIQDNIGKDIPVSEIYEEGDLVDVYGITKGKGTQGPLKRFGIGLKPHKSEKGRRRPGTLGDWKRQQHNMPRVPMAGQTGYQQRSEENLQVLKISDDPDEINVEGGYKNYGLVQNEYILVKGSVPGPSKRMLIFTKPSRPPKKKPSLPTINYISTTSKQGR